MYSKETKMSEHALLVEDIGAVRKITFNRPNRRNPLSYTVAADLHDLLLKTAGDSSITAVVITGSGSAFCAGGDQDDFRKGFSQSSAEVLANYPPMDIFKLAKSYRKPLIAAVNGAAFGGGMGITCVSHLAVASEKAIFGIPEIKLGIFPLTILPLVRPVLGERLTMELALTGRHMSASEALSVGLVCKVVPDEELEAEAMKLAAQVGSFSPLAVRLGLEAMQTSSDMSFNESMEYLNTMRTIFFGSEDLNEGANAFMEKRAPVWKGR
jgi:enoyl-CoA hydratase/carnithine racemase